MSTSSMTSNDASQISQPLIMTKNEEEEYSDNVEELELEDYHVNIGFGNNYYGVFGSNAIPIVSEYNNDDDEDGDGIPPGTFVVPQRVEDKSSSSSSSSKNGGWKIVTKERELDHWSAGGTHTCGVSRKSGKVNMMGTVQGHVHALNRWLEVRLPLKVVQLASGRRHTLALVEKGLLVLSWGSGYFGQLGHGPTSYEAQPRIIERLHTTPSEPITAIAAGAYTSAAILNQRIVFCWGSNRWGQCTGRTKSNAIPIPTPLDYPFTPPLTDLSLGQWHGLVRASPPDADTTAIWVWGKCHDGTTRRHRRSNTVTPPTLLSIPAPTAPATGAHVTQMVSGTCHSLFLTQEGQVYSWGSNQDGQLGIADTRSPTGTLHYSTAFRSQPVLVTELKHVTQIAAAGNTSVAVVSHQYLYTWGYGDAHQLGHAYSKHTPHQEWDSRYNCSIPTPVSFLAQQNCIVQHVACGPSHTLVYCKTKLPKRHPPYQSSRLQQQYQNKHASNTILWNTLLSQPPSSTTLPKHTTTTTSIISSSTPQSTFLTDNNNNTTQQQQQQQQDQKQPQNHQGLTTKTFKPHLYSKPKLNIKRLFCQSFNRGNRQNEYSQFE